MSEWLKMYQCYYSMLLFNDWNSYLMLMQFHTQLWWNWWFTYYFTIDYIQIFSLFFGNTNNNKIVFFRWKTGYLRPRRRPWSSWGLERNSGTSWSSGAAGSGATTPRRSNLAGLRQDYNLVQASCKVKRWLQAYFERIKISYPCRYFFLFSLIDVLYMNILELLWS